MKLGFIGLGYMGSAIATTLIQAGYELMVHDIREEAVQQLTKLGAKSGGSPQNIGKACDIVFSMVLNDSQTREVVLGEDGVLTGMEEGTLVIMSTVTPQLIQTLTEQAEQSGGIDILDAPVTGVPGAAGGTMTFMVGGSKEVFASCRSVLEVMAKTVYYCGPSGAGMTAKLTNALIWEVSWIAVAQALELGVSQGLEKDLLLKIYNHGLARCWSTEHWHWVEQMRSDPDALALEYKDMGLVAEFAAQAGLPSDLMELCYQKKKQ